MKNTLAIFRREVFSFFVTPRAYFVITGFIFLAAYFFFNIFQNYNLILQRLSMNPYQAEMYKPNLNEWVVAAFFQTMMVVMVFLIPILTMRLISEEKRSGTFELLATSPLKVSNIVWGKFLSAALIVTLMLSLMFLYPALMYIFGDPKPELMPMFIGFLGLLLYTLAFTSIGMAVSAFAKDQIVAAISTMVILLLYYVIHAPAESVGGVGGEILNFLSPVMQAKDFMKGVMDTKALIYFLTVIIAGIFLSQRALDGERNSI